MLQKSGQIALNPQGGIAIKILTETLIGQKWKRSVLKQRMFELVPTEDSRTQMEWVRGNDLNIAIFYPKGRYSMSYLRQRAKILRKVLIDLEILDHITIHNVRPSQWKTC